MPGPKAAQIKLSEEEKKELSKLEKAYKTGQQLAKRAKLILLMASNQSDGKIAAEVGVARGTVLNWRKRWLGLEPVPLEELTVAERLEDLPRSGAPLTITADQRCQFEAIACQAPEEYGRPISQWTARELADEVVKQGIMESLSKRHASRLLKEASIRPHKSQYWLNTPKDEEFVPKMKVINDLYRRAHELLVKGEILISNDEMTGVQALERKYPEHPTAPGQDRLIEYEYIRHGTWHLLHHSTSLLVGLSV